MRAVEETIDDAGAASAAADDGRRALRDMNMRDMGRVMHWRLLVNVVLMVMDGLMFMLAALILLPCHGIVWWMHSQRVDIAIPTVVCAVACAALWVLCLCSSGVYHRHVMGDGYELNLLLVKSAVKCWIVLCAVNFMALMDVSFSALTLVTVIAWLLTVIERAVARAVIVRRRARGRYSYGTVIVGSPDGIRRMLAFLTNHNQLNYRPMAVCPIRANASTGLIEADIAGMAAVRGELCDADGHALPVLCFSGHLAEDVVDIHAQTVMVCDVMHRFSDNFNTFALSMESLNLEIALVASAVDISGHETQIRSIQGTTVLTIRLPQYGKAAQIMKRVFDIVVSVIAIVVTSPIMAVTAIAIKREDGGPILYSQERIGLRGRPFRMYKFRSMVTNADALKRELARKTGQTDRFIFKMKHDPRVTRVGSVIRRFSIDELPQFFNVFRGDMSVVGPRPPLREEWERYNQVYATRMLVKPGITGPWQVSGRSDLSAEESQQLDVSYVQNWSMMGDVLLLMRTVGAVLGHKGAY